jgi:ketosteroid isomerase-like protein
MAALALWLAQDHPPRWQLAGAFVRRDSATVRRLLAPDVMVWPPSPDTARRGSPAVSYLQGLALSTRVTRSDLRPRNISVDGRYLVEEGIWTLTSGRTKLSTRYDLRWRQVDGRWRVSFFQWDLFR